MMNAYTGRMGCWIALALLGWSGSAWANGFRNPPESAAGMALDGGRLNLTDDASAVAVNPAGLAEIKQNDALGSLTIIHTETEYRSPAGRAKTDEAIKLLPNFFAAFPTSEKGPVVGVGVTTPFGQSTVWEEDSLFRYTAPYEAELTVVNVNPSLGYRVNEALSVGAGLDVYSSQLTFKQFIPWSSQVPGAPDGKMKFDADGDGLGWNLGARLTVAERHHLSATYRSPVKVDYDGDFRVSQTPPPLQAVGLGLKSDFSSEIEFPSIVVVGYGLDLTDRIRVGVDAEWVEFSRYDELPLDIAQNNPLLVQDGIPQDWDDIWTFGTGVEWKMNDQVVLRGGYKYLPSPVPSSTLAPTLPDADKHQLSAGVGFRQGAHRVDVGYAYAILDDRTISANVNPAYNGEYEPSSHILSLSYGLTF
jgi:long-chain fatty acid transport protein